jgi:hypothetical protein
MSSVTNTGGGVDVHAFVSCFGNDGLARVNPHLDAQKDPVRPRMCENRTLSRHGSHDSVSRSGKRHKEGIPLHTDLLPAAVVERGTKQSVVLCNDVRVTVA